MKDNDGQLFDENEEIKRRLQIDRTKEDITNGLLNLLKEPNALFSSMGPCGSVSITPYPDKYFVAQEFNENKDDLRRSIDIALNKFGYTSIAANDFYLSDKLICKIAALIQGTPFGVYQLTTSQNRNVYLELGIAFGLGKPFVLVKDKNASPTKIVRDIEYYSVNSYLGVQYELGNLLEKHMATIGMLRTKNVKSDPQNKNIVIYHGDKEDIDITVTVAKKFKEFGFTPVILGDRQESLIGYLKSEANFEPKIVETRDQIIEAIQTSKLGVFRAHKSASADNFVALGVSIGLNKPFLSIQLDDGQDPPSDLSYLSPLKYVGYLNLGIQLTDWIASNLE